MADSPSDKLATEWPTITFNISQNPSVPQSFPSQSSGKMVNGKWLPILQSAWKHQHSISFIYRSYHLPMPDQSPSTLTVLNSNFLQLGRRSGGRPQQTVYPRRLPINTVIHNTLAGIEPTTCRLLVWRATSSATPPYTLWNVFIQFGFRPMSTCFFVLVASFHIIIFWIRLLD